MAQGPIGRYVPSGVNAQSWLGFEQRIQERRFRALLDAMNHAITAGDTIEARVALEEARELRPDAPELAAIEERIAAIPIPVQTPATAFIRSRVLGAVMLLLVGITLLMGIDWIRSADAPIPETVPVAASPELPVATPVAVQAEPEQAPVTIVPPPAAGDLVAPATVGTAGLDRAIPTRPANPLPQPPPFRAATAIESAAPPAMEARPGTAIEARPRPINGETPDDFVFVPPQPAAVSRQPAVSSLLLPPGATSQGPGPRPLAAAPTPAAAAVVASPIPAPARGDQTSVAAVLNQYARAYGQLDANAAREVWPTVNERALARAFAGLTSQDVAFDDCEIDVRGARANASCRGKASYVGKIGSGEQRTESRTWRFELRRDGDDWKIENAEARRQ